MCRASEEEKIVGQRRYDRYLAARTDGGIPDNSATVPLEEYSLKARSECWLRKAELRRLLGQSFPFLAHAVQPISRSSEAYAMVVPLLGEARAFAQSGLSENLPS